MQMTVRISDGSAIRRAGIFCTRRRRSSGSSSTCCWASVTNPPGAMTLTWISCRAHSAARAFVSWISPPLEAE